MFQIGDHVMLKEHKANDILSEYYGQVFEVKGIDYFNDGREAFIDIYHDRLGKISLLAWRLEKIHVVDPIDFDDVMNLL